MCENAVFCKIIMYIMMIAENGGGCGTSQHKVPKFRASKLRHRGR